MAENRVVAGVRGKVVVGGLLFQASARLGPDRIRDVGFAIPGEGGPPGVGVVVEVNRAADLHGAQPAGQHTENGVVLSSGCHLLWRNDRSQLFQHNPPGAILFGAMLAASNLLLTGGP